MRFLGATLVFAIGCAGLLANPATRGHRHDGSGGPGSRAARPDGWRARARFRLPAAAWKDGGGDSRGEGLDVDPGSWRCFAAIGRAHERTGDIATASDYLAMAINMLGEEDSRRPGLMKRLSALEAKRSK